MYSGIVEFSWFGISFVWVLKKTVNKLFFEVRMLIYRVRRGNVFGCKVCLKFVKRV